MHFEIQNFFPKAWATCTDLYKFSEEELEFIKNQERAYNGSGYNFRSENTYILKSPEMKNIFEYVSHGVRFYAHTVLSVTDDVEFYITQSWINWTETGQSHHEHAHPNSIISGVFYIDVDDQHDRIHFINDKYDRIHLLKKEVTPWNTVNCSFETKIGQMMLFDSSVVHCVEPTTSKSTRISLSFNVFAKGNLGFDDALTQLIL